MTGLLRDLRLVVGGEGDWPVPMPARPWRRVLRVALFLGSIAVGLFAYSVAYQTARSYVGEGWYQLPTSLVVVWAMSALPLVVVDRRPLLAWRIAWVLTLVSLAINETNAACPPYGWFQLDLDPLDWTIEWSCSPWPWFPGQVLVFGVVLIAVGAAQRRRVLWWVWLATAVLIAAGANTRHGPADFADQLTVQVAAAGLLLGANLLLPRLRGEETEPSRPRRWETVIQLRDRWARCRLREWLTSDLRRTLAGGPDEPPPLGPTAWGRRVFRIWIAVAAILVAYVAAAFASDHGDLTLAALWPLSAALLVLVTYRPLLAWRLGWVLGLLGLLIAPPEGDQFHLSPVLIWVCLAVLFVVGTTQPVGVLLWVWLATVPLALPGVGLGERPGAVVMVTVVLLAGYQVQRRRQARHRLAEAQERGTVLTERARIARELHDVVAHHMSMIVVRSETAPYRLGDLPETARNEFEEISAASREALTEMRRLLGVLRSEEPAPPMTAPQPGLADLPELVASARATGVEITVDVDARLPELPPAVDVSAYRIVQEALTNAARHALGAPVQVVIGRAAGGLALSVRNGPGLAPRSGAGPGHGVRGMRERAAMLGGELRVGPSGDGGFEVSAVLPLRAER